MKILKFSFPYTKLGKNTFTTIRKGLKFDIGDTVQVLVGKRFICYAKCIGRYFKRFYEIPTPFFLMDFAPIVQEPAQFFKKFYKTIDYDDIFTIYIFRKIVPKSNLEKFAARRLG